MPDINTIPPEKLHGWKTSGKLDKALASGKLNQAQYDAAMNRIESAGGVMDQTGEPEEVDAATAKRRAAIAYDQQYKSGGVPWARASGYIPGVGDVPLKSGPEWDGVKDKVPGYLRDANLLPSRDAVWQEPMVQQAHKELGLGDDSGIDADSVEYRQYADQKWHEAYETARSQGKAIYRARDIGDDSPDYLRNLKWVSKQLEPLEAIGRKAADAITLGESTRVLDAPRGSAYETMHGDEETQGAAQRLLGVTPPPPTEADLMEMEGSKRVAKQNIEQGDTTLGRHPLPEIVGNVAGAAAPFGASRALSRGAEAVTGAAKATGVIGNFARNAGAGFMGGVPSEYAMLDAEDDTRKDVGMPSKYTSISAEALKRGAAQGLFSGLLATPRGASSSLRSPAINEGRAANVRALEEGGGGTSNRAAAGVVPPPGYEEMSLMSPTGAEAGFRDQAASGMASELNSGKDAIMNRVGGQVDELGEGIAADADQLSQRLETTATGAYYDGAAKTKSFDEGVADMTERVRSKLGEDLESTRARHQSLNEEALASEGASPVPPPPGVIADLEDHVTAPTAKSALGLETDDVPRISSLPIIGKYHQIAARMAFADGANMPNSTAKKFKAAMDTLVEKRIVTADELPLYNNIAIGSEPYENEAGEELFQVAFPRKMDAREMDDFINAADEMAKMPVSTGPDAQRWTEVGAVARQMRTDAFPRLTQAKEMMHAERSANEELLRSLGLNKTAKSVEGVDATASVGNAMKSFAEGADFKLPDGMAVPRKNFERWLAVEHPDMLDGYMALRSQAATTRSLKDLGIHYDNTLPVQKKSIQELQDALTGKHQQAEAVMGVFSHVSPQMKATRTEAARLNDVFKTLSGGQLGESVTIEQRAGLRNKLMEVAINGPESGDWATLTKQLRPEQVKELSSIHRAVTDVDKMFSDAGLGKKYWRTAEAGQVSQDLFRLLADYKRLGASPEFTKIVENASPATRNFMLKARASSAYASLRNEVKSGANYGDAATGKAGVLRSFGEALNYHLDALYQTSTKGGKLGRAAGQVSGIASPVRAGVGLGSPTENENVGDTARQAGKTVYTVGSSLKNMLVDAVEHLGQKYGPKAR